MKYTVRSKSYVWRGVRITASVLAVAFLQLFFWGCQRKEDSLETLFSMADQTQIQEASAPTEVQREASETETGSLTLWVHICGYVKTPGIYEMPADSRLYDLLMSAGGFAQGADETALNLADYLKDGSQIYVPGTEETAASGAGEYAGHADGIIRAGQTDGLLSAEPALVNINTASQSLLETLPGIGAAKAKEIIAYRQENGFFASIEEIKQVDGIKDALFKKIKSLITVEE